MMWSFNIGRIAGTVIRIHVTFLIFLLWIWTASYLAEGTSAAWSGLIFMLLLFACVLAHEFGHILTARAFGVATPDVTLLPIGGVARLERIPEEPRQELLIALAGPAVNVVIAIVLIAFVGSKMDTANLSSVESVKIPLLDRLAAINLFLALFNMIPAFPMDGGRVLRALLAVRFGFLKATQIAAVIGQGVAFALGFIGLFYNPVLIFIAIFVYLAAASEAQFTSVRLISRGVPLRAAMITEFARLAPEAHIDEAVQTMLHTSQSDFPVLDGTGRLVGLLRRNDIVRALRHSGPDARVTEAMVSDIPTVDASRSLDDALHLMQKRSAQTVGVIEGDGRLVGLITSETLAEMVLVGNLMPRLRVGT
jgi:Zn-dependent protease/CBS domain-containing protein